MQSKIIVIFVLAIGVAGTMWAMSGIAGLYNQDPASNLDSPNEVENRANNSSVSDGGSYEGPVNSGDDESSIVGLIISGGGAILKVITLGLLIDSELRKMGFPPWFTVPVGATAQIILSIGFIQMVVGRVYR